MPRGYSWHRNESEAVAEDYEYDFWQTLLEGTENCNVGTDPITHYEIDTR